MKKVLLINSIPFFLMTIYAIIRYNFAQEVGFDKFFFFVINKSIAYTALFSVAFSALLPNAKSIGIDVNSELIKEKKNFGSFGFYLALVHIFMTIRNINPDVYPKFFDDTANITLYGTLAIIFGILTILVLLFLKIISQKEVQEKIEMNNFRKYLKTVYLALFFILMHNYFIGGKNWLFVEKWAWYMPPITLISAISIIFVFYVKAKSIFINKQYKNNL